MGTINSYTEQTTPNITDEYLLQETGNGANKKITLSTIRDYLLIGKELIAYSEAEATALIAAGWLELNGQTYSATSYPLLAAARPEWVSGGTITMPDLSNRVRRVKGDDTGDAGTEQEDQLQGFYLAAESTPAKKLRLVQQNVYNGDSSSDTNGAQPYLYNGAQSPVIPTDDGTNGTPRTGTETRAKALIVRRFVASDAIFG